MLLILEIFWPDGGLPEVDLSNEMKGCSPMSHASRRSQPRWFLAAGLLALLAGAAGQSFAASRYKVGSGNTTYADPYVPRPHTTPCAVTLFTNVAFENFNPYDFQYTPPANCPGPWQKVVFEGDIRVTKGVQYDRTANFWIGGANIYFGTTAEPSPQLGPHWHVESDLTDYSPLFTSAQDGQADIGNLVNGTYTGIIYASATLEFYPLNPKEKPPTTFDAVLPLSAGPDGGTVALTSGTSQLAETFTLPTNIVGAYLDVFAQSQNDDEFWYTCVPNNVSSELESCGNTAFREGEVTIDGQPAGVAPIYPWIFTGGIDPYLWFPLPGVQTLNFTPYRVNLTPFAGLLSNGQQHTVALSVFNSDNYFSATATLLLNLDPNSTQVTGQITENTLPANPTPKVKEKLKDSNGKISGTVSVTSDRNFTISGYVTGSSGTITTTVQQNVSFINQQGFVIDSAEYVQSIEQSTDITSWTTQVVGSQNDVTYEEDTYPLSVGIHEKVEKDGTLKLTTTIQQEDKADGNVQHGAHQVSSFTRDNVVSPTDTLKLTSGGIILGHSDESNTQHYVYFDSTGSCYDLTLSAANNVLTHVHYNCNHY
jgi:hypothetical protein